MLRDGHPSGSRPNPNPNPIPNPDQVGYATGIPLGWWLGKRRGWPVGRPLLGVWLGNVWALSFAALWALLVVLRLPWRSLRPLRPLAGAPLGGASTCAGGAEEAWQRDHGWQRDSRTEALLPGGGGGAEPASEALGWRPDGRAVRPVNE